MSPHNKSEVLNYFSNVWANTPERDIGCAIIEFLSTHIDARTLPISVLIEIGKRIAADNKDYNTYTSHALNVINYLAGADLHLLTPEVELITDDDEIYHLDPNETIAATTDQINPLTGDFDPDLKRKLFICFTPSSYAKETLGR